MKRLLLLAATMSSVLCMTLSSCTSAEETYAPEKPAGEAVDSNYDDLARNLALAVSRSAQSSPEFRKIVKEGVLKQFDGDYDLLLSQAASLPMAPVEGVATRSAGG